MTQPAFTPLDSFFAKAKLYQVLVSGTGAVLPVGTAVQDMILVDVDTSLASDFKLPPLQAGLVIWATDKTGTAATHPFTIKRNASEQINGAASDFVVSTNRVMVRIECDGVNWFASASSPAIVSGAITPEQYGAKGDGITDDTAAFSAAFAAMAAGPSKLLQLSAKTYLIGVAATPNLPANCALVGVSPNLSILKTTANGASGTAAMIAPNGGGCLIQNVGFLGNNTGANQNAILSGYRQCTILNCWATNMGGWGFLIYTPVDLPTPFGQGCALTSCRAINCTTGGFEIQGEFTVLSNCISSGNGIGVYVYAGNMVWTGGEVCNNTTGVYLFPSGNDCHGVISGVNIKHNVPTNIYGGAVQNGMIFTGCSIYEGNIQLVSSNGLVFTGCEINVNNLLFDGSIGTVFQGCLWSSLLGSAYLNTVKHNYNAHASTTRFDADNYDLTGNYPSFLVPDTTVWRIKLPTDPGLGVLLDWHRADMGITIATGVSAWADQSGTADANKNAVQATGSKQPTLNASDALYRGWPTISFSAASSQFLQQSAWSAAPNQPITIYVVGNDDGLVASEIFCDGIGAANRNIIWNAGAAQYQAYAGTALGNPGATSSPSVFAAVFNGATSVFYRNAKTAVASGPAGAQNATGFTLGSSYVGSAFLNGKLAEFIVYQGAHTASQVAQVLLYLGARYGIAIS